MSGSFLGLRGEGTSKLRADNGGEGHPVGGPRGEGVAAGDGRPVVLAGWAGVRSDKPRAEAAFSLEPG